MNISQLHYLPLPITFFSFLVGTLFVLVIILQFKAFQYAYIRLGLSRSSALLLLLGSLLGSYINIPIVELSEQRITTGQEVDFWGMRYVVPVVVNWPGTVIAINVGGAIIPGATSVYLLLKHSLWIQAGIVTAFVTAVCYYLAQPIPGLGIALPVFVPAIASVLVALVIARSNVAPLAYIGGCFGTLFGADVLNLGELRGLGVPVASIGGAGTFDGIFLTGVIAVLLASLSDRFYPNSTGRESK